MKLHFLYVNYTMYMGIHRLPRWPAVKNLPANAGDVRDAGSIP